MSNQVSKVIFFPSLEKGTQIANISDWGHELCISFLASAPTRILLSMQIFPYERTCNAAN